MSKSKKAALPEYLKEHWTDEEGCSLSYSERQQGIEKFRTEEKQAQSPPSYLKKGYVDAEGAPIDEDSRRREIEKLKSHPGSNHFKFEDLL